MAKGNVECECVCLFVCECVFLFVCVCVGGGGGRDLEKLYKMGHVIREKE